MGRFSPAVLDQPVDANPVGNILQAFMAVQQARGARADRKYAGEQRKRTARDQQIQDYESGIRPGATPAAASAPVAPAAAPQQAGDGGGDGILQALAQGGEGRSLVPGMRPRPPSATLNMDTDFGDVPWTDRRAYVPGAGEPPSGPQVLANALAPATRAGEQPQAQPSGAGPAAAGGGDNGGAALAAALGGQERYADPDGNAAGGYYIDRAATPAARAAVAASGRQRAAYDTLRNRPGEDPGPYAEGVDYTGQIAQALNTGRESRAHVQEGAAKHAQDLDTANVEATNRVALQKQQDEAEMARTLVRERGENYRHSTASGSARVAAAASGGGGGGGAAGAPGTLSAAGGRARTSALQQAQGFAAAAAVDALRIQSTGGRPNFGPEGAIRGVIRHAGLNIPEGDVRRLAAQAWAEANKAPAKQSMGFTDAYKMLDEGGDPRWKHLSPLQRRSAAQRLMDGHEPFEVSAPAPGGGAATGGARPRVQPPAAPAPQQRPRVERGQAPAAAPAGRDSVADQRAAYDRAAAALRSRGKSAAQVTSELGTRP